MKYTVIGKYIDNDQSWMQHVEAETPEGATVVGVAKIITLNGWDMRDVHPLNYAEEVEVVEVIEGHHTGLLDNEHTHWGRTILEQALEWLGPKLLPVYLGQNEYLDRLISQGLGNEQEGESVDT